MNMFAGKIKQGLGNKSVQPQGQEFPALQATLYQFTVTNANKLKNVSPEDLEKNYLKMGTTGYTERPYLCIAEPSKNLLSEKQCEFLGLTEEICYFDDKDSSGNVIGQKEAKMYIPSENIRWVILSDFNSNRNKYKKEKNTGKIQKTVWGEEWSSDYITVNRAYLAAYDSKKGLLTNDKDEPQIFGLSVESKKANYLFGTYKDLPSEKTIHGLNNRIKEEMGEFGWFTHLVSTDIVLAVVNIVSKVTGKSSMAVTFHLGDNVEVLPDDTQTTVDEFVKGEFFTELNADPFRLNKQGQSPAEEPKTRLPQTALTPDYEDADKTTEELTEEQKKELEEIPF